MFYETYKCPLQNPRGWVVDDVQGALCLEGTGPGLVMRTLKTCPCPMGPPCFPTGSKLEMGWLGMEVFKPAYKIFDTDLGVVLGLQWVCL